MMRWTTFFAWAMAVLGVIILIDLLFGVNLIHLVRDIINFLIGK